MTASIAEVSGFTGVQPSIESETLEYAKKNRPCIRISPFQAFNENGSNMRLLSEQHYYCSARVAGGNACAYFGYSNVNVGYRFRAVFRP